MWRAASSIFDYDIAVISTLAIEKGGDASGIVATLGSAPKGSHPKDLLLVIEGEVLLFVNEVTQTELFSLTPLLRRTIYANCLIPFCHFYSTNL